MNRSDKLSILIVDDQWEVLEIYQDVLKTKLGHQVESVAMPGEALRLVKNILFDIVIIDAKMTYKGAPLGGLILAAEIGALLGSGSILLMSQYDVREEVRHYDVAFSFLSKPRDGGGMLAWVERELMNKVRSMIEKQYGFVAMPYGNPATDEWYNTRLVPWMKEAGFAIRRMDEIPTTRAINHEMLLRIKQAHFVVVYVSEANPNVYFEAGYAIACDKYVVVFSPTLDTLPFDIRSNHALTVGHDFEKEREILLHFMSGLRGSQ